MCWSSGMGLPPLCGVLVGIAQGCHLLPRGLLLSQLLDKDLETALCLQLSGAGTKQFSFKAANSMSLRWQEF